MARVQVDDAGIRAMVNGPGIRNTVRRVADLIQDEAVRLTAAELVATGLMAASWRITDISTNNAPAFRVHNTARSAEGTNYPLLHEHGFRHHSGKHVAGRHIAGRSIDAARR